MPEPAPVLPAVRRPSQALMETYDAFLLLSFGGPEHHDEVMPFLRRVSAGRGIPDERLLAVAEHYYAAGGASPLNAQCRELLSALGQGTPALSLPLYWGNRNWHPLLEDTLAQMRDDGARRALAFVTSAYGGYSSCRQYLDDIAAARSKVGAGAPEVDKLRLFYNHPAWVGAWAKSASRALASLGAVDATVLFSAHSIPLAAARTSPYEHHVNETARLVAEAAGVRRWQLVWQSRSGRPGQPWLGPDICESIEAERPPAVVVVPIGFVLENMEVVHDLDVDATGAAGKVGARFVRADCVSGYPEFVAMVKDLVHERLDPTAPRPALGEDGPWPDSCPAGHCPPPTRQGLG
ncbi:MAG: ferrochelatase [Actinomycetota bacterium]|nr:ferrochelatase [Actinomycetota bacterium]